MDVVPTLSEVKLCPALRQRAIHEVVNQPCQGALVRVRLLQLPRNRLHRTVQMQGLTALEGVDGLRPYLPHNVICQMLKMGHTLPLLIHLHRPPSAAARLIADEIRDIGRRDEDALTWIPLCAASVGGTERVLLLGNKLLDQLKVCLADRGQLAELDQPEALYVLHRIFALDRHKALGVPAMRELAHKGGLALPLLTNQRQNRVELDARLERTADGRRECFTCYGTVKLRVLRPEVVNKDCIKARDAVPCQPQQVVLEGVERMARRDLAERILDRTFAADAVNLFEVIPERGVVAVHPHGRTLTRPPRQIPQNDDPMREVVDRGRAPQRRIVLEDQLDIFRGALVTAHNGHIHLFEPAVIFRLAVVRHCVKVLPHLRKTLLADRYPNAIIGCRELLHRLVAWQASGRCLRRRVLVAGTELMDAHKVKRVDQLPAARIRRMMAEKELAVIVDDCARSRRPHRIGVTVIRCALLIDAGQERIHRLSDAVCTAERADDALLGCRVLLLLGGLPDLGMHA